MAPAPAAPVGGWLLLTCCWVLTLMSLSGAARLPTAYQRGLLELNSNKPQRIRANLMHRDHPESPLSVPGTTTADRYNAAAARHNARMARRGLATAGEEFNTSIGSALAEGPEEYIMTLYFGTPVQKFFLIVDTGSSLVWVQCLPCIHCYNETNPYFDPTASSSYSAVPCTSSKCNRTLLGGPAFCSSLNTCDISHTYPQVGSEYHGVLSTETISFNNSTSEGVPNFLFGCMNNNTASFGHVDGFAGFGKGEFSLPSQLSALTSIKYVFSYCLVPYVVSTTLTSSLVFGVPETNELQLVYTPILNNDVNPRFYWVNMTGISINGIDVSLPTTTLQYNSSSLSGTIFDSGSTYMAFNEDIWTTITKNLKDLIIYPIVPSSNTTICYNISGVQQLAYPNMTLHFSGLNCSIADFLLTGQNLFVPKFKPVLDVDVECLAISPGGKIDSMNVIGNVAQADHYIEIDVENMKIGWTSRDCSLPM